MIGTLVCTISLRVDAVGAKLVSWIKEDGNLALKRIQFRIDINHQHYTDSLAIMWCREWIKTARRISWVENEILGMKLQSQQLLDWSRKQSRTMRYHTWAGKILKSETDIPSLWGSGMSNRDSLSSSHSYHNKWRSNQNETWRHARSKSSAFYSWRG